MGAATGGADPLEGGVPREAGAATEPRGEEEPIGRFTVSLLWPVIFAVYLWKIHHLLQPVICTVCVWKIHHHLQPVIFFCVPGGDSSPSVD